MARPTLDQRLLERIDREAARLGPTRLTVAAVDWDPGPDPGRPWAPAAMTPLSGTPAFRALSDAERLRYNQYYALQLAEEFAWVERRLIAPALARLLRGPVPGPALRGLIERFLADERHHAASFARLLGAARPDLYGRRARHLFTPPWPLRAFAGLAQRLPRTLWCWVELTAGLEALSIAVSDAYKRAGDAVDPLFRRVYLLHARDEARHCRLDSVIAGWLAGGPARRVNQALCRAVAGAYYDAGWGCDGPVRRLVKDFPALRGREAALLAEARRARRAAYAEVLARPPFRPAGPGG